MLTVDQQTITLLLLMFYGRVLGWVQADYYGSECHSHVKSCGLELMTPDLDCLGWGTRILVALVLEHVGLFILWLIRNQFADESPAVTSKKLVRETVCIVTGSTHHATFRGAK